MEGKVVISCSHSSRSKRKHLSSTSKQVNLTVCGSGVVLERVPQIGSSRAEGPIPHGAGLGPVGL